MSSMRDYLTGKERVKSRRHRPSNLKIALLIAVVVLLVGTGGGVYWFGKSVLVPTDPETLCPMSRSPSELLVLLLDMSDAYTSAQSLQIRNELRRLRSGIRQFGLIEVYAVDRAGEHITQPLIHLCNPGTDKNVNRIYQNPEMARQRWTKFSTQLNDELTGLMASPESDTSPIFEAVQSAALQTLNLPEYDNIPKRLIVVSDLLQNVPGHFSHYRGPMSFDELKQVGYFSKVRANLTAVDVQILYLVRPGTPQGPQHLLFWEQYFTEQGATVSAVVPIYGADRWIQY